MKKPVAYIFLIAYSVLLLRPAIPFVADVMAHAFWYSQHIATVHYENGKYHVHYQCMDESKKSIPGKNSQGIKTENFAGDYMITEHSFEFSISPVPEDLYSHYSFAMPNIFPTNNYPPPRA